MMREIRYAWCRPSAQRAPAVYDELPELFRVQVEKCLIEPNGLLSTVMRR